MLLLSLLLWGDRARLRLVSTAPHGRKLVMGFAVHCIQPRCTAFVLL